MAAVGLWKRSIRSRRALGQPLQKWITCLGELHLFVPDLHTLLISLWTGIQTYLHLTQFRGERGDGNQIWERLHTWDDSCYNGSLDIHSNTGMFTGDPVPALHRWPYDSSALHCLPPQSSVEMTPQPILSNFTTLSWNFWMIRMRGIMWTNCLTGGIGMLILSSRNSFPS